MRGSNDAAANSMTRTDRLCEKQLLRRRVQVFDAAVFFKDRVPLRLFEILLANIERLLQHFQPCRVRL